VNGAPYRAADGAGIGQERDTTTQKRTWLGTVRLAARPPWLARWVG
jgi:hypothetical protein